MTDKEPIEPEETPAPSPQEDPKGSPAGGRNIMKGLALALMMIPIGGLIFRISGNAVLYGWLDLVPKMSYGEACGVMTLAWLIRFFMYR